MLALENGMRRKIESPLKNGVGVEGEGWVRGQGRCGKLNENKSRKLWKLKNAKKGMKKLVKGWKFLVAAIAGGVKSSPWVVRVGTTGERNWFIFSYF